MTQAKKSPIVLAPSRGVCRQLEFLYARRYAIDSLIDSLQAYNRASTVKSSSYPRKRKTA